jgi:DNA-binding XRE family transcriptional regulator
MITKKETKNCGPIFKAVRFFFDIKQTEFSQILGVTQGYISKIESQNLSPELAVWFNFVNCFAIKDADSFIKGHFEFDESAFVSIKNSGAKLAPAFDFKEAEFICTISDILPLWNYLDRISPKESKEFLKRNGILHEIFLVKNHPLTMKFVRSVFFYAIDSGVRLSTFKLATPNFKMREDLETIYEQMTTAMKDKKASRSNKSMAA